MIIFFFKFLIYMEGKYPFFTKWKKIDISSQNV